VQAGALRVSTVPEIFVSDDDNALSPSGSVRDDVSRAQYQAMNKQHTFRRAASPTVSGLGNKITPSPSSHDVTVTPDTATTPQASAILQLAVEAPIPAPLQPVAISMAASAPPPPLATAAVPDPVLLRPQPRASPAPQQTLAPLRVLIVDDSSMNVRLLERSLYVAMPHVPLEVVCVGDGQAGLDAIAAAAQDGRHYDIALVDGEMPVLDGYGMVMELRRNGFVTPVIGVTGNVLPDDLQV
jgi:CheY-like chemotaxis protein